jgi:LysR family glycine cleavage system transcriptional activator
MIESLPPLNAALAFEAAARLGSFTRAAAELHVTPTAVSHHVKVLESSLGRRLFQRRNNSVVLTPAGRKLAAVLSESFGQLASGIQDALGGRRGAMPLVISVQPDFALKWLIPRLREFSRLNPAVELRVVTGYRALDLISENIDVAVRYLDDRPAAEGGTPAQTTGQLRMERLFGADLMPVMSPSLFPGVRPPDVDVVRRATLLHVSGAMDEWRLWLDCAAVAGVDATLGPAFDSYTLSIESAIQGWGIALGRIGLIEADIAAGRLVAPFATRLKGHRSWFMITAQDALLPHVAAFGQFLVGEAQACRQPA